MVSKALSSAPRRRMAWSRAAANCDSVSSPSPAGPRRQQGEHGGRGPVGDGRGPLHPDHLPGVLDQTESLDQPPGGHQRLGRRAPPRCAGRPGHMVRLEPERPARRGAATSASRWAAPRRCTTATSPADPGRRHLFRGLGPVPPVGGEQGAVAGHQEQAGRPAEPGQPADVGRRGDHRPSTACRRRRPRRTAPAAVEATGDVQGGHGAGRPAGASRGRPAAASSSWRDGIDGQAVARGRRSRRCSRRTPGR